MKRGTLILWLLAAGWYSLFSFQYIDLTTADLGRHLKTGEIVMAGGQIPRTNLYSYTSPAFPTVDHHWGSGVLFYLLWKAFGFKGLSIALWLLSLLTFTLFFRLAITESGIAVAFPVAMLAIRLIAERVEIRPEAFSYLFVGLFITVLWEMRQKRWGTDWLWLLPVCEIVWVNLHIYFFVGPVLVGAFLLESVCDESLGFGRKRLAQMFLLCAVSTLINPFGWRGAIAPFQIFQNYGHRIFENQSVILLLHAVRLPVLHYFLGVFSIMAAVTLGALWRRERVSIGLLVGAGVFSVMAWAMVRNLALFGLFALLYIPVQLILIFPKLSEQRWRATLIGVGFLICGASAIWFRGLVSYRQEHFGAGLMPGNASSAEFFLHQGIHGPIFNDYDIGSYLIYYLYSVEPVFVDNRPEAYPISFFTNTYTPMLQDERRWLEEDRIFHFNAIFFSNKDVGAHDFLVRRIEDPRWVAVYADAFAIIYLKRSPANEALIRQFGIPKERFRVNS